MILRKKGNMFFNRRSSREEGVLDQGLGGQG
jgi:hypothetical protein